MTLFREQVFFYLQIDTVFSINVPKTEPEFFLFLFWNFWTILLMTKPSETLQILVPLRKSIGNSKKISCRRCNMFPKSLRSFILLQTAHPNFTIAKLLTLLHFVTNLRRDSNHRILFMIVKQVSYIEFVELKYFFDLPRRFSFCLSSFPCGKLWKDYSLRNLLTELLEISRIYLHNLFFFRLNFQKVTISFSPSWSFSNQSYGAEFVSNFTTP